MLTSTDDNPGITSSGSSLPRSPFKLGRPALINWLRALVIEPFGEGNIFGEPPFLYLELTLGAVPQRAVGLPPCYEVTIANASGPAFYPTHITWEIQLSRGPMPMNVL